MGLGQRRVKQPRATSGGDGVTPSRQRVGNGWTLVTEAITNARLGDWAAERQRVHIGREYFALGAASLARGMAPGFM